MAVRHAFSCSLLIIAVALAGAAPAVATAAPPHALVVDARTGEIMILAAEALSACGGMAPFDTYCSTGDHDAASIWLHGFASPFPQAATLESRLLHDTGMQIFRCTYFFGDTLDCQVTGVLAPGTGTIHHDCFAYLPRTGGLLPAPPEPGAPTGVPGGYGPWECLIV